MTDPERHDLEPHRKVGRRFADHAFYWMPLILGGVSLISSIVIVIGAYWTIRSDVQLLNWRIKQMEDSLNEFRRDLYIPRPSDRKGAYEQPSRQ
jgi:hypothetical protein